MKRGRKLAVVAALAVAIWQGENGPVFAHTTLRNCIQHRVELTMGALNTDLTVELTFNEDRSAVERARMDANSDGRIARTELNAYLDKHAEVFRKAIHLTFAGRECELVPLYDPQVDLLGDSRVTPHAHALRLCYFVRTPAMRPGDAIAIREDLWLKEQAIRSLELDARDGSKWQVSADRTGRGWRVQCRTAPQAQALNGRQP